MEAKIPKTAISNRKGGEWPGRAGTPEAPKKLEKKYSYKS